MLCVPGMPKVKRYTFIFQRAHNDVTARHLAHSILLIALLRFIFLAQDLSRV
jgi:hypothetical protein